MKFFKADNGCVGIRAILPTVEGEQVKAAINAQCDAAWRAAHPDRAETASGHDDELREQRLADALVAIVAGEATSGAGRTAVIVTMQAETLEAQVLGAGPVPTDLASASAVDNTVMGWLALGLLVLAISLPPLIGHTVSARTGAQR